MTWMLLSNRNICFTMFPGFIIKRISMGKKQHQKDKMYLTTKEWSTLYGGKKAAQSESNEYRRLPYNYCGLSLQPAEHPYCTEEGVLYDLTQIVPFLKKFKHCPITGEPLNAKSLMKVIFHRNADGNIHCPIMYKEFTEHSHVVVLKNTGLNAISQFYVCVSALDKVEISWWLT